MPQIRYGQAVQVVRGPDLGDPLIHLRPVAHEMVRQVAMINGGGKTFE